MVPILYFSVVTRGNIIVFGHKFLAMAQKAYQYSCSQGSLFLMDGLKRFFWPIKLILPIKVVFKIFGDYKTQSRYMNMIGLMFSRNFREYFSAWLWNSFLYLPCQRECNGLTAWKTRLSDSCNSRRITSEKARVCSMSESSWSAKHTTAMRSIMMRRLTRWHGK